MFLDPFFPLVIPIGMIFVCQFTEVILERRFEIKPVKKVFYCLYHMGSVLKSPVRNSVV